MVWINRILSLLKYWRVGGVVLLTLACLLSFHLAKSRGEKLDQAEKAIEESQQKIKQMEKAIQDERERQDFKTKQNKKIKMAQSGAIEFAPPLRDAYDSLRERQAGRN